MDILEAFLKKLKNEISRERVKLRRIEDEILSLAEERIKLEKEYCGLWKFQNSLTLFQLR
ncbi:MAG: hypothetical protein Q9M89_00500 [Persephonella sp.]|nr:hypothetical protein [Persephonella sp.]